MKLWVDDERIPNLEWRWARTTEVAKTILETGRVDHLSLDHDLGDSDGNDGYALCLWMAENEVWPNKSIYLHSDNPVGVENMRATIARYGHFEKEGLDRRSFHHDS